MSQAGPLSAGAFPGVITFLEGNTGGPVGPDGGGIINVIGAGTITVTGNAGTNTLTITDMDSAWTSISSSQMMSVNMGYFCVSPGGALSLSLPAVSAMGDVIAIVLDGATSFAISQGAGQTILYGNLSTTAGFAGSLSSTQQGDSIRLVCRVPNLRWVCIAGTGNLTVV